jgi:Fe-Mn family superoxide dismutase
VEINAIRVLFFPRFTGKTQKQERKYMMTRREALKTTTLVTAAAAAVSTARLSLAQPPPPRPGVPPPGAAPGAPLPGERERERERRAAPANEAMTAEILPTVLPPLPYPVDALEPFIDAQTMQIHHDKHHAAYVTNLTKALADHPTLSRKPMFELMKELHTLPENVRTAVRNQGGGHHNHSLFWRMMRKGGGGEPRGELRRAIDQQLGGFAKFKELMTETATKLFGSGWAWLVLDGHTLKVEGYQNQDSPLSAERLPLLGVDVWEHAYYLKYQNRRPEYVANWFNVINWDYVAERYAERQA